MSKRFPSGASASYEKTKRDLNTSIKYVGLIVLMRDAWNFNFVSIW